MYRHDNMAQSLDGYLWAVSSLKKEKMRIRCLEDSHLEDIKPPLTIVYMSRAARYLLNTVFKFLIPYCPGLVRLKATSLSISHHPSPAICSCTQRPR